MKKKREKTIKYFGIRVKLIGAFLVPAIFILLLGGLSTQKASQAIIANYQTSTLELAEKSAEYYDILLENCEAKLKELATDNVLGNYYSGQYIDDPAKEADVNSQLRSKLSKMISSDNNILTGAVLAPYGRPLSSTGLLQGSDYKNFIETEEGKWLLEHPGMPYWSGHHTLLDQILSIDGDSYGLSVGHAVVNMQNKVVGFAVADIKMESISQVLQSISLPEGSIGAFVTPGGREISGDGEREAALFYDSEFFTQAMGLEERSGIRMLELEKKSYLYIYSKVGETGCSVNILIPQDAVTKQADEIRNLTYFIAFIAIITAVFIGVFLASGFSGAIDKVNRAVRRAAEGDLTVKIKMRRKDEFRILSNYIHSMLESMKHLICNSQQVSKMVLDSSNHVSNQAEEMVNISREISRATQQMEQNMGEQSDEAVSCLAKMNQLGEKIQNVYGNMERVSVFSNNTKNTVSRGIEAVSQLETRVKENAEITQTVLYNIEKLERESQSIGGIIETINGIAEETNLLSLNASIEAARAGEAGRGFSVVAEEIRKLSDATLAASREISQIITGIQDTTKVTARTAKQTEEIREGEELALENAVTTFKTISEQVDDLKENIDDVFSGVAAVEEGKNATLKALQGITQVLSETAVISQQIQVSAGEQLGAAEGLNTGAEQLKEESLRLQESIRMFKIDEV